MESHHQLFIKGGGKRKGILHKGTSIRDSFFFYLFICCLFLAALGLLCCARAFSSCGEWGLLFIAVRGLLIAVASLAEYRL